MYRLSSFVALAFALAAAAAPSKLLSVQRYPGSVKANSYVVTLKSGVDKAAFLEEDTTLAGSVTHGNWDPAVVNGFAGVFNTAELNKLRASDLVESIQEDGIYTIQGVETTAPWGLGRISSLGPVTGSTSALNYTYTYSDEFNGSGVDIYVVDTGIKLEHDEFQGRATWGWSGSGLATTDDNGHGTHVSGTAAGVTYGVAKGANLIAVKVLNGAGSGTLANVIGGFDFARTAALASGRPSIATASLGGGASSTLDDAVAALVAAGIPATIAAGNSNVDAINTSPARVPGAITVGATTIADARASFSNYGSIVDIWAPGANVISSYIGSGTSNTASLSGTSMATPHVAGLVALYLSEHPGATPDEVVAGLPSQSGVISGLPSGSINRFATGPITV